MESDDVDLSGLTLSAARRLRTAIFTALADSDKHDTRGPLDPYPDRAVAN